MPEYQEFKGVCVNKQKEIEFLALDEENQDTVEYKKYGGRREREKLEEYKLPS